MNPVLGPYDVLSDDDSVTFVFPCPRCKAHMETGIAWTGELCAYLMKVCPECECMYLYAPLIDFAGNRRPA